MFKHSVCSPNFKIPLFWDPKTREMAICGSLEEDLKFGIFETLARSCLGDKKKWSGRLQLLSIFFSIFEILGEMWREKMYGVSNCRAEALAP